MEIAIDSLKHIIRQNEEAVKQSVETIKNLEDKIKQRNETIRKAKINLECIEKGVKTAENFLKTMFGDKTPTMSKKIRICDDESEKDPRLEKALERIKTCKMCSLKNPKERTKCFGCEGLFEQE